MHVNVKLYTTLAKYIPGKEAGVPFDFKLDDNATISDLVNDLKLPQGEVKIVFVNGRNRPIDFELNNGDDVGIFPAIGGG